MKALALGLLLAGATAAGVWAQGESTPPPGLVGTPAPLVLPGTPVPLPLHAPGLAVAPAPPGTPSPLIIPTGPTPAPAVTPSAGSTAQMAFYVLLLLGLFAGGAWLLRTGLPGLQGKGADRRLHIRETRSLGGRQFLVVAEYEGRKMLLGVCPGRIEHLCELGRQPGEPQFPHIEPPKPI